MKYSENSVVIIGSGAAGLYAALKISQQIELPDGLLLVTKSSLGESNSKYAQGGIVGVLHQNKEDSIEELNFLILAKLVNVLILPLKVEAIVFL